MHKSILFVPIALAALACSDQPTSVANTDEPSYRAAQGDRSDWTLLWTWGAVPRDQAVSYGVIPCFNGGAGEEVLWWGPEAYAYAKVVVTPSGQTKRRLIIENGGDGVDHYLGVTSGDEWVSDPFAWEGRTNFSEIGNGGLIIQEPVSEEITSLRTGERMRILFMWQNRFDGDGNVVGMYRNPGIMNCHILTH